jgi:hypothetical protein
VDVTQCVASARPDVANWDAFSSEHLASERAVGTRIGLCHSPCVQIMKTPFCHTCSR